MAEFAISGRGYNGAYCMVDTFRHLLTDKDAINHLHNIARHLNNNGIYILGLHLLPDRGVSRKIHRWQGNRGRLTVRSSITVLDINRDNREETLCYQLRVKEKKYSSVYKLRTYTCRQFMGLLEKAGCFIIMGIHDLDYDMNKTIPVNGKSEDIVCILRKV